MVGALTVSGSGVKRLEHELAKLQRVERGELRKQLRRDLAKASKPARMRVRDAERDYLPSGMDKSYGRVPVQTLSLTPKGVSMRWRQRRRNSDLGSLDRGRLRHPVYGNRKKWVNQSIPSGMWRNSVKEQVPTVKAELERDLVRYTQAVSRG